MRRRSVLFLALAAAVAPPAVACAHPMPNSTVLVEVLPGLARLSVSIPWSEMAAALGKLDDGAGAIEAQLRGYLPAHASIRGADGRAWTAEVSGISSGHEGGDPSRGRSEGHPFLVAVLTFTPAAGASTQARTLRYDAVTHRVASHYVLVYRKVGEGKTPLGRLQAPTTELELP